MSDLGPVPELDYDAALGAYSPPGRHRTFKLAIDAAAAPLLAYAHAARERIEELEAAAAEYVLATEARIEQLEGELEGERRDVAAWRLEVHRWRPEAIRLSKLLDEAVAALDEISLEAVDGSATRKSDICVMAVGAIARINAERHQP